MPPGALWGHAPFGQRVELGWDDESSVEASYEVWRTCARGEGEAEMCLLATLAADSVSYVDNTVGSGATYTYRVSAQHLSSTETESSELSVSTPEWPTRRISLNLAPADIRKDGALFDLPIALGSRGGENRLMFPIL